MIVSKYNNPPVRSLEFSQSGGHALITPPKEQTDAGNGYGEESSVVQH